MIKRAIFSIVAIAFVMLLTVNSTFAATQWLSSTESAYGVTSPGNALGGNNGTYAIFPSGASAWYRWSATQSSGNVLVYLKAPSGTCIVNLGFYNNGTAVAARSATMNSGATGAYTVNVPGSFNRVAVSRSSSSSGACWVDAIGKI